MSPPNVWPRMLLLTAFLVAFLIPSGGHVVPAEPEVPPYAITDIKAYLYLNHKDALSRDISNERKGSLWNTIIGAGLAGSPSRATLVVVEISGRPDDYASRREVEVTVRESGKKTVTKLKQNFPIGGLNEKGKYFAPFLVYDTGCLPLDISARLLGQPAPSSKLKRINFECGE